VAYGLYSIVGVGNNSDGFFLFKKDSFDILLAGATVNIYTITQIGMDKGKGFLGYFVAASF
jgi:hypothetical protein